MNPRREIALICWFGLALLTLAVILMWAGVCPP